MVFLIYVCYIFLNVSHRQQILLVSGMPATGKSWLGNWLQEHNGYIHIDAERGGGADFDRIGVRSQWERVFSELNAEPFVLAIHAKDKPTIVSWGFPNTGTNQAGIRALKAQGVHLWWLNAEIDASRHAFVVRETRKSNPGQRIPPECFNNQVLGIQNDWSSIHSIFHPRIINALLQDGTQKQPDDIWKEMYPNGQEL